MGEETMGLHGEVSVERKDSLLVAQKVRAESALVFEEVVNIGLLENPAQII
jgi:hypothetical protein